MRCIIAVSMLVALIFAGAGCKDKATNSSGEQTGAMQANMAIRLAMFEPKNIDPNRIAEGMGRRVAEDLFEGLLGRDPHGKPIPGSATSWDISDDHKTYTFHIRKGLVWSDGTPITAGDFEWSMQRALAPKTGNSRAYMLFPIRNARAYNKGTITDTAQLGVRSDGEERLIISLERPYPLLPELLTGVESAPTPRHVIEKVGLQWTRPEHFVGNGPFRLTAHRPGQDMRLERNEKYWDVDNVQLKSVRLRFTTQSKTAYDWYRLDEVDVVADLVPSEILQKRHKAATEGLHIHSYDGLFYMLVNTGDPALNDPALRRAIDLSVDRSRLTRQVLASGEKPASSFVPPGMTAAQSPRRTRYNPEQARKLLDKAGYGKDKPLPSIRLAFNTNPRNRSVAEFIQRSLKENLGLSLVLENMEWKTYLDHISSTRYQLGQLIIGGGIDPMEYFSLLESGASENRSHWSDATFDALAQKGRNASSEAERDALITQALARVDEQMPIIPLWVLTRKALVRPGITGYHETRENLHPLRWMRWEKP